MTVEGLTGIRDRVLPMFQIAAEQYHQRVPEGYPNVSDHPEQGMIGLEIDPNHALYITTDGDAIFAEMYRRSPRTDNRAGAGRQKQSGLPVTDQRPLSPDVSDQTLRNLIAEMMSHFNSQQGLLYITDD